MSTEPIVLFDLPSRPPCRSWSPNPWKVRLLLNYKGLAYTTEWTEYVDIKRKFESHVPPNETGTPYTIPTVKLGDGTYVMESNNIAETIEKIKPEPSLHLDSPYVARVQEILPQIFGALRPVFIPRVPKSLLNDASVEYWLATRIKERRVSIEQYEAENPVEECFKNAELQLGEMTALLKQTEGPFFMGSTPGWADFIWVGFLVFYQRLGEGLFDRLMDATSDREVHLDLLRAAGPWLERDDH